MTFTYFKAKGEMHLSLKSTVNLQHSLFLRDIKYSDVVRGRNKRTDVNVW
jgi:hypothetical protein